MRKSTDKSRAYNRAWNAAHPEAVRAAQARYRERHGLRLNAERRAERARVNVVRAQERLVAAEAELAALSAGAPAETR